MVLISKILLFSAPMVVSNMNTTNKMVFEPVYVPSEQNYGYDQQLPDLNPKNECNFDNSSNIATKKVKHFAYDCNLPRHNWLLISMSEANYYDVLLK